MIGTNYKIRFLITRQIEDHSIYKCGEDIGASGLVDRVKSADDYLKSVAWPLSIIE